ncbi:MAG: c-type cytochrome [Leptolyngbyaceae cyanobacterium RU_5_1]|nr:c-type cytochrome [Leptolyngbyaceae cyanobacterium RU_5_1]
MKRLIVTLCLAIALMTTVFAFPAYAADIVNGAKVFNANCSACHLGGNNVIIPSKTLKKETLEKYGMYSSEAIKNQVTKGRNAMPSFRSRLNEAQIEDVAAYVLSQSEKGW